MKNIRKLNKIYWVYGGVMGLLMVAMEILHYKTLVRELRIELFGVLIGTLFMIFGIWLGISMYRKKHESEKFDANILGLSKREVEVLELLSQGLSNQEVADKLFVSLNTAKTHISNIYGKLNVKRRTQAIQKARDMAIIHPPKE